jgi:hypothetical protein
VILDPIVLCFLWLRSRRSHNLCCSYCQTAVRIKCVCLWFMVGGENGRFCAQLPMFVGRGNGRVGRIVLGERLASV